MNRTQKVCKWIIGSFALLACSLLAGEQVYEVNGVVRGKLLDGRPVIEHEEIPGYMMAMTMPFNVADKREISGLFNGDKVNFLFHVEENASYADHFVVTGKEISSALGLAVNKAIHPLELGDSVPDFQLVDESGTSFTQEAWLNQYTLVTFFFTRCPVPEFCPLLATKFYEVQTKLPEDLPSFSKLRLMSITLDPEFDSSAVLAAYGKRVGADSSRWNFATGEKDQIELLARAFKVASSRNKGSLDHRLSTALIGTDGTLLKCWPGNRWNAEQVITEIESAIHIRPCCSTTNCEP